MHLVANVTFQPGARIIRFKSSRGVIEAFYYLLHCRNEARECLHCDRPAPRRAERINKKCPPLSYL